MAKATEQDTIIRLTPDGELVYKFTVIPEKQKFDVACFRKNEFDTRTFFNVRFAEMEECFQMDNMQLGYLILLGTYLHYDSNVIFFSEGGTKPITEAELDEIFKKHPKTAKAISNKLKAAGLIELVDYSMADGRTIEKVVQLKDGLFYRGPGKNSKNVQTAKAFNKVIKQLYAENGPALLGALAKLLPYADTETNLIVSNPQRVRYGSNYEKPQPLSMNSIADILGMHIKAASRLLHGGRVNGHSVFIQVKNYSGYLTKLSPEVFCKMAGPVAEAVLYDFISEAVEL